MVRKAPIHMLSALVTIATDSVWKLDYIENTEFPTLGFIILIEFLVCFVGVSCIERFLSDDNLKRSLTKGLAMGIVAAVPVLFVAGSIGALLALWAGADMLVNNDSGTKRTQDISK